MGRDTFFLSYTDKMVTKDSAVIRSGGIQGCIIEVGYLTNLTGSKKLRTFIHKQIPPQGYELQPPDTSYFEVETVWNGGNCISKKDSSYQDHKIVQTQWTYDNYPNPFFRVSVASELSFLYDATLEQRNANNMTRLLIKDPRSIDLDLAFQYEYRADGYPVIQRVVGTPLKGILRYADLK